MKKIVRFIVYFLFFIFLWPLFIFKRYGLEVKKSINKSIIISNHYSDFDPFFIYLLYGFKNKLVFLTYDGVKKNLLTRLLCYGFDCIYVSHDPTKDIKVIKECFEALNKNKNLVIFPEGAINPTKYGFFEFSRSFCYLARKAKADIIIHYIYPRIGLFKKSFIYVGETVKPETIEEAGDDDKAATRILSKVMDYALEVRKQEKLD